MSDMDGQTREGEAFGLKPNQPVRNRWASQRPRERERMSQLIPRCGQPLESFRSWLHRLMRSSARTTEVAGASGILLA